MRIGIDLGGTKTEVIALDDAGEQRFAIVCLRRGRITQQTDRNHRYAGRHGGTGDPARPVAVGIGIPGSLSPYTGVVKNANYVA
ncbi:fructokinase [Salmonella enterica subsp. enterica]|uniref:Fructokinase n=1 Tax=Salmonella enterica I TaxID=59201 RepID=A0A379WYN6_SALET|nr:fructokinase [Salmonella enterica subsp. enterica]